MTVEKIIAALRAKTVANGCTPSEEKAAQLKIEELETKHGLRIPAPPIRPQASTKASPPKPAPGVDPEKKRFDDFFGLMGFTLAKRSINGIERCDLYTSDHVDRVKVCRMLSQNSFEQRKFQTCKRFDAIKYTDGHRTIDLNIQKHGVHASIYHWYDRFDL